MVEPDIDVRYNRKERSWEVVVDFGKYGALFDYRVAAEEYARGLQNPQVLQEELSPPGRLTKLERR